MIVEDTTLLEGSEGSQVAESKHKKVTSGDEERYWPPKKAKEKYYGDAIVKMGGANLCERCMSTRLSRLLTMDLTFIFVSYFIFSFPFLFFYFSIFRTTQVRGYQSRCHISHNLMA